MLALRLALKVLLSSTVSARWFLKLALQVSTSMVHLLLARTASSLALSARWLLLTARLVPQE